MTTSEYKEVIFISDVHFGVKNGMLEWVDNMRNYFENFFIPLCVEEKKKRNKPCVVVAGDYFDNRTTIDINVLNTAVDVMEKIAAICDVYVVIGNHDIYKSNERTIASLRVIKMIKNVHVVDDTYVLNVNGKTFFLVSWIGNMTEENKLIAKHNTEYDFFVFHTELSGMTYDNNRPIVNGLNVDISDDTCRILSGHIHKRQESKKALYFGSPYALDRKDIGNIKGIYIFKVADDGTVNRFFKENDYSPKFLNVKFADIGRKPDDWKDIISNNYVDIVMTSEEISKVNVANFVEELMIYSPKNIQIIEQKEVIECEVDVDFAKDVKESKSMDVAIINMFDRQVSKTTIDDVDKDKLMKINVDYLKRAEEELNG
jgi:DNA repair exonuclease SbcCD nuclease subunit